MNIAYEFLSERAIENVITCLNYSFDKVVLFGYTEAVKRMKKQTKAFLQADCGVTEVLFVQVRQHDLQRIMEQIRDQVRADRKAGGRIFFDATGGESLLQIAFGMLSAELQIPIHNYDVKTGKLHLLQSGKGGTLSEVVPQKKIRLDLDMFIRMYGGRLAPRRKRKDFQTTDIREIEDDAFRAMIPVLWEIAYSNEMNWTLFSEFLKKVGTSAGELHHEISVQTALQYIDEIGKVHPRFTQNRAKGIMKRCRSQGVFSEFRWDEEGGTMRFTYASAAVKKCMIDPGSILELYVGEAEQQKSDDCRIGVRIDWDGVLHSNPSMDVENEIDVLSVKGYTLCFTSCKFGRVGKEALYELATVANRFGGDYTHKRLVTRQELTDAERLRAEELGIEVVQI